MSTTAACWPAGTQDRFRSHYKKCFDVPYGKFKAIQKKAIQRLDKFFTQSHSSWRQKTVDGKAAALSLKYFFKGGFQKKKARKQRYHTDNQILALLISRVNVTPFHADFTWLQIRWTPIEDICKQTGFSRSCVNESLRRFTQAGLLRTKRRKNPTKDREWVAQRWLTATVFDMVGLSKWLKDQRAGTVRKTLTEQEQKDLDRAGGNLDGLPAQMRKSLQNAMRNARARPPDKT